MNDVDEALGALLGKTLTFSESRPKLRGSELDLTLEALMTATYPTSPNGQYTLKLDEKVVLHGSEMDIVQYIHENHCYSVDHALKHEGYSIEPLGKTEAEGEPGFNPTPQDMKELEGHIADLRGCSIETARSYVRTLGPKDDWVYSIHPQSGGGEVSGRLRKTIDAVMGKQVSEAEGDLYAPAVLPDKKFRTNGYWHVLAVGGKVDPRKFTSSGDAGAYANRTYGAGNWTLEWEDKVSEAWSGGAGNGPAKVTPEIEQAAKSHIARIPGGPDMREYAQRYFDWLKGGEQEGKAPALSASTTVDDSKLMQAMGIRALMTDIAYGYVKESADRVVEALLSEAVRYDTGFRVVARKDVKGNNGQWYSPIGGFPSGVTPTDEERTYYVWYDGKSNTTIGKRYPDQQSAQAALDAMEQKKGAEYAQYAPDHPKLRNESADTVVASLLSEVDDDTEVATHKGGAKLVHNDGGFDAVHPTGTRTSLGHFQAPDEEDEVAAPRAIARFNQMANAGYFKEATMSSDIATLPMPFVDCGPGKKGCDLGNGKETHEDVEEAIKGLFEDEGRYWQIEDEKGYTTNLVSLEAAERAAKSRAAAGHTVKIWQATGEIENDPAAFGEGKPSQRTLIRTVSPGQAEGVLREGDDPAEMDSVRKGAPPKKDDPPKKVGQGSPWSERTADEAVAGLLKEDEPRSIEQALCAAGSSEKDRLRAFMKFYQAKGMTSFKTDDLTTALNRNRRSMDGLLYKMWEDGDIEAVGMHSVVEPQSATGYNGYGNIAWKLKESTKTEAQLDDFSQGHLKAYADRVTRDEDEAEAFYTWAVKFVDENDAPSDGWDWSSLWLAYTNRQESIVKKTAKPLKETEMSLAQWEAKYRPTSKNSLDLHFRERANGAKWMPNPGQTEMTQEAREALYRLNDHAVDGIRGGTIWLRPKGDQS